MSSFYWRIAMKKFAIPMFLLVLIVSLSMNLYLFAQIKAIEKKAAQSEKVIIQLQDSIDEREAKLKDNEVKPTA